MKKRIMSSVMALLMSAMLTVNGLSGYIDVQAGQVVSDGSTASTVSDNAIQETEQDRQAQMENVDTEKQNAQTETESTVAEEPGDQSFVESEQAQLVQEGNYQQDSDSGQGEVVYNANANVNEVIATVAAGLKNVDSTIDISGYELPKNSAASVFSQAINNNPDLFYVSSSFSYSYNSAGYIVKFTPKYLGTAAEIEAQKDTFYAAVNSFKAQIDSSLSDAEIALQVHDNLATTVAYDYDNYKNNSVPAVSHTAYGALVDHVAVCDGYALAYSYLLNQCFGISTSLVTSTAMNHAWNVVKIDGNYYHVDVTYDDPVVNGGSKVYYVYHNYFLCSDDGLKQHYSWDSGGISCYNTKYDDADWRYLGSSQAAYSGIIGEYQGLWYFVDGDTGHISTYSFNTQQTTDLGIYASGGAVLPADGCLYYFSGLSTRKLYRYDLDSKETVLAYQVSADSSLTMESLKFIGNDLYYGHGDTGYPTGISKSSSETTDEKVTVYNGVDYSAVYDPDYYRENNADVAAAFGNDQEQLIWHFVEFGMAEGRCAKADFNVVYYKYALQNDDLRNAYGGDMKQYYYHYMNYGQYEGRSVSDYDAIFDADYYLEQNPDVYENIVSRFTSDGNLKGWALWHYCEFGMSEGRSGSENFKIFNYLAANADVYAAYQKDLKLATVHYLNFGKNEGRSVTPSIDIYTIPQTRPDVVTAFGNNKFAWVSWYINFGSKGM